MGYRAVEISSRQEPLAEVSLFHCPLTLPFTCFQFPPTRLMPNKRLGVSETLSFGLPHEAAHEPIYTAPFTSKLLNDLHGAWDAKLIGLLQLLKCVFRY
jgi:hypothetical protein